MTSAYTAASRVIDQLSRQLLVRPHAAFRRRRKNTTRRGSPLLAMARRWPWRTHIVGMAVCEKRTEGKRLAGEIVVTFLVQRKLAATRLERHELIPKEIELRDGTKVLTDVVVASGVPVAEASTERPLRPGCAIGHFRGATGSMGPIVRKAGTNHALLLSCSHVIARAGLGAQDDAIEQPPDDDGRIGTNVVATLTTDFTRLNPFAVNPLDAALAKLVSTVEFSNEMLGGGRPAGVSPLRADDLENMGAVALTRFGARTGVQPGVLEGVHAAIPLEIPALGPGTVVFGKVGLYRTHSLPGDSGAPILRSNTAELFGLHIGRIGEFGVFCPIQPIFDEFALELAL